jgi:hypothetical protein
VNRNIISKSGTKLPIINASYENHLSFHFFNGKTNAGCTRVYGIAEQTYLNIHYLYSVFEEKHFLSVLD